jgi:hypothetical protein
MAARQTPSTTVTASTPDVGVVPSEATGPPWNEKTASVVSWPDVTDETPISLTPPTQQGSLPTATFEFTLTNDTDVRFDTNFYDWAVWKQNGDEWHRIAPEAVPEH